MKRKLKAAARRHNGCYHPVVMERHEDGSTTMHEWTWPFLTRREAKRNAKVRILNDDGLS